MYSREKCPRISMTVKEKLNIIKHRDSGVPATEIANQFGIGKSTVRKIIKSGDQLKSYASEYPDNQDVKRIASPRYSSLDTILVSWVRQQISPSGTIIQAKATEFAEKLGISDFKATNGWLANFKKRNSTVFGKTSPELENKDQDSNSESKICTEEIDEAPESDESFETIPKLEPTDPISEYLEPAYNYKQTINRKRKATGDPDEQKELLKKLSTELEKNTEVMKQHTTAMSSLSAAVNSLAASLQSFLQNNKNKN